MFPCFGLFSSYGQSLAASTLSSETLFSCFICVAGLVFFSHLIGNVQVIFVHLIHIVFDTLFMLRCWSGGYHFFFLMHILELNNGDLN